MKPSDGASGTVVADVLPIGIGSSSSEARWMKDGDGGIHRNGVGGGCRQQGPRSLRREGPIIEEGRYLRKRDQNQRSGREAPAVLALRPRTGLPRLGRVRRRAQSAKGGEMFEMFDGWNDVRATGVGLARKEQDAAGEHPECSRRPSAQFPGKPLRHANLGYSKSWMIRKRRMA
jgi:hypothetical protein